MQKVSTKVVDGSSRLEGDVALPAFDFANVLFNLGVETHDDLATL
jgi:hypothetical protein